MQIEEAYAILPRSGPPPAPRSSPPPVPSGPRFTASPHVVVSASVTSDAATAVDAHPPVAARALPPWVAPAAESSSSHDGARERETEDEFHFSMRPVAITYAIALRFFVSALAARAWNAIVTDWHVAMKRARGH